MIHHTWSPECDGREVGGIVGSMASIMVLLSNNNLPIIIHTKTAEVIQIMFLVFVSIIAWTHQHKNSKTNVRKNKCIILLGMIYG